MKTLVFLCILIPIVSFSQDFNKHLWKDRLILILADSYQHPKLVKQRKELINKQQDLKERKLLIYQITPTSYQKGTKNNSITKNTTFYKKYNPSNENFKIILVGLDGSIKLVSNNVEVSSRVFDTVDQMPIRRQEIEVKN